LDVPGWADIHHVSEVQSEALPGHWKKCSQLFCQLPLPIEYICCGAPQEDGRIKKNKTGKRYFKNRHMNCLKKL